MSDEKKLNYSYDPTKISENGLDRMRLELGDTIFNPGELTAALCDEEYIAIIGQYKNWRKAKLKCLEAILMKFAHQVNVSVDGLSYSFSDRVKFWKQLYDEIKKSAIVALPVADARALNGREGGPPYFYENMNMNPRRAFGRGRR